MTENGPGQIVEFLTLQVVTNLLSLKQMKTRVLFFVFATLALSHESLKADDEIGYDTLVRELSADTPSNDSDLFSNLEIHMGAAASTSMSTFLPKSGQTIYAAQRAVQASIGIDLFSRHWLAEGSFVNFIDRQFDDYQVRLKEFDLKIIYRNRLDSLVGYRIGAGLAARYLSLGLPSGEESYTTPFSVITGGLETYLMRNFSIGVEVATRNTMTYETPDQSALDLTLRFDGHF